MEPNREISQLTDKELKQKLQQYGGSLPPVTAATRPLLEKRLQRLMGVPENSHDKPEAGSGDGITPPVSSTTQPMQIQSPVKGNGDGIMVYYGVQCPEGTSLDADEKTVFTDQRDALKFMKKYPGSRFKVFSSPSEAERFSDRSLDFILQSPMPKTPDTQEKKAAVASEGSTFRGPKPQDLVKLRKLIETGNTEELYSLVWSNPRFLVTSGDTPTILQEGFRYNALHSAAMKNQSSTCQFIIDTIEDRDFMAKLYPDDCEETRTSRIRFLLDLYLNMPDKGNNETPLHFACKFGHREVTEVLASHPRIDKNAMNRYGQKPKDVICSRVNKPFSQLMKQILDCLEDRYYVPLLRSADSARIAKPWSPTVEGGSSSGLNGGVEENDSRACLASTPVRAPDNPVSLDAGYSVKAFAGPMSPVEAQKFRKTWLTPPSPSPQDRRAYTEIRRGDTSKGLERLGRRVADDFKVPWCEYWDFLQCFVNLKCEDGLNKLERYLESQTTLILNQAKWEHDLDLISKDMEMLKLNDSSFISSNTSEGSPEDVKRDRGTTPNYVRFLMNYTASCNVGSPLSAQRGTRTDINPCQNLTSNLAVKLDFTNDTTEPHSSLENNNSKNSHNSDARTVMTRQDSHDSSNDGSYVTALDDLDDYQDMSNEDIKEPPIVFIYGCEPSKTDVDVLRALENVDLSPSSHPHIYRWWKHISSFSEQTRSKWSCASPCVNRGYQTPNLKRSSSLTQPVTPCEESPNQSSSSEESSLDLRDDDDFREFLQKRRL